MDAASLETGIALFTNWQTVSVGLTIYVMTSGIRRVLETWKPALKSNRWWREVFLPLGPIGNGLILAVLAGRFPWPDELGGSLSARAMYALVCGLGCGWLYGRVRGLMGSSAKAGDIVSMDQTDTVTTQPAAQPDPTPEGK